MKNWMKLPMLLTLVGVIALSSGCGKNLPCETDPSQVDDARTALASAQEGVESAQAELSAAQSRSAEINDQLEGLEDADALRERLEELKKGSGR